MTISPVNSQITTEDLQDFLRGFTFSSSSKNPVIDKDFRTIELSITDLGGGTENTSPETTIQSITFNVIESNDPPAIAVSDAVVSEPVGASSIISLDLGPSISISDADDEFYQRSNLQYQMIRTFLMELMQQIVLYFPLLMMGSISSRVIRQIININASIT